MTELRPKHLKGKKPQRVRKPSRPLDGINHRLLKAAKPVEVPSDSAPVTRAELEQKARELGIKFDGRSTDAKLLQRIEQALKG